MNRLAFDRDHESSKSVGCTGSALPKCSGRHWGGGDRGLLEDLLFLHASKGQIDELDELLCSARPPDIDARDSHEYGATALMLGARHGHESIVDRLLSHKQQPNINKRDDNGSTALFHACLKGHSTCAARLLMNHPPPNLNVKRLDGFTALMTACEFGHTACLE
jgi:ankyrin repeat protein